MLSRNVLRSIMRDWNVVETSALCKTGFQRNHSRFKPSSKNFQTPKYLFTIKNKMKSFCEAGRQHMRACLVGGKIMVGLAWQRSGVRTRIEITVYERNLQLETSHEVVGRYWITVFHNPHDLVDMSTALNVTKVRRQWFFLNHPFQYLNHLSRSYNVFTHKLPIFILSSVY